jgi:hypothetical protein
VWERARLNLRHLTMGETLKKTIFTISYRKIRGLRPFICQSFGVLALATKILPPPARRMLSLLAGVDSKVLSLELCGQGPQAVSPWVAPGPSGPLVINWPLVYRPSNRAESRRTKWGRILMYQLEMPIKVHNGWIDSALLYRRKEAYHWFRCKQIFAKSCTCRSRNK